MANPLKMLLAVLGSLLLLLVAAAIALPLLFDPNDYRVQIAEAVKKETGREFTVGDIRLAVFPWLRVELKDVALGNAEGFGAAPMLTVQRAELGVRLLPLLQARRIEASGAALQGVVASLAVNAEGRNNWQDLIKPVDPAQPVDDRPLAQRLEKLDIGSIELDQVKLDYDDQQGGKRYQLDALQLKVGRLHEGKAFPVEGRFKATANAPQATASVAFSTELTLQPNGDLLLSEPRLKLDASQAGDSSIAVVMSLQGASLQYAAATQTLSSTPLTIELQNFSHGSGGKPALSGKGQLVSSLDFNLASGDARLGKTLLKLDLQRLGAEPLATTLALTSDALIYTKAAQTFTAQPLKLQLEGLRIGAADKPTLTASGRIDTQLASDLGQQKHLLKTLAADLQLGGSALPGGKAMALKLGTGIAADLAAHQLRFDAMQLAGFGLKLTGKNWLLGQLDSETPTLDGEVAIAPFEPRVLMAALGITVPPTADAKVLTSASLTGQLNANARRASLKNLTFKLDDTTLRGDLAVRDFSSKALDFALSADRLDADRYLPPAPKPGASVGADATPAAKADANATPLPIEALDQLNAQGTLQVESMKLKNLKLAKVRLKLDGTRGATHRQQLSAALYGGSADLNLAVAPGAKHTLKLALSNINAGPLLKDFINSDKLSGRGSMMLDASSSGRTLGAVKQALDGKLAFNLADGAVKGFNLGQILRDGQALLARQAPAAATAQSTDFAELRGSGVITNGVLRSDDLTAKNPLLRLEGAGEVDLVKETINYLAKPTVVNTASGQGGKERLDLSGIVVPIRVSGDLYRPKVSVDWQAALKQQAVSELREKLGVSEETVREKREELRAKAKEEIGKGLLKLFGSKPAAPPPEPAPAPADAPPAPAP